jgi:hypothetical protein
MLSSIFRQRPACIPACIQVEIAAVRFSFRLRRLVASAKPVLKQDAKGRAVAAGDVEPPIPAQR